MAKNVKYWLFKGFLMKKEEKTVKSDLVFDGKVLHVYNDQISLADGRLSTREIIHHNGGVCVLALVDGKIPLVKQFRYAYKKEMFELPAGKLEKGEDSYAAGIRELEEETGLKTESLVDFGFIYPSPGYTDEIIHMYFTDKVTKTHMHLDEDENIDVYYFSLHEILKMIENNQINDAKTICLVLKYYQSIK